MNPLNSPESRAAVLHQAKRFRELFDPLIRNHGPLSQTIAPPEKVLSFAEDLMLCPTEEASVIRMQRDLESARGFRIIAHDVAAVFSK